MTLQEEFRDAIDQLVRYCTAAGRLSGACAYELDAAADLLLKDTAIK